MLDQNNKIVLDEVGNDDTPVLRALSKARLRFSNNKPQDRTDFWSVLNTIEITIFEQVEELEESAVECQETAEDSLFQSLLGGLYQQLRGLDRMREFFEEQIDFGCGPPSVSRPTINFRTVA